jgi:hypothetical protein
MGLRWVYTVTGSPFDMSGTEALPLSHRQAARSAEVIDCETFEDPVLAGTDALKRLAVCSPWRSTAGRCKAGGEVPKAEPKKCSLKWGDAERPRQDSNLRHRLRRPVLYPLSYGGGSC